MSHLENLYISPLESCNLNCRYCYTQKTKAILTNRQILSFVKRYQKITPLKSIIFCGGEVFTLKSFPSLVNHLQKIGIFISIITNGTIDRLPKINDSKNCQLIVSLDGPQKIHDYNRGSGNFAKTQKFISHAHSLGFPVEIFYLVTKDSYPYLKLLPNTTYLPDRLGSLSPSQLKNLLNNYPTYPSQKFGCHQISLQSDGLVYPCCETSKPIGKISDPIKKIIDNYLNLVSQNPLCVDPDYWCNIKHDTI
jgi:hypothetical protein